ncbi:MAG: carboxymuconolactone decarboxylase family protein [Rhodospirillales bacterium]|nr:carboxymuconolactone decarboxylase family protein [Rhodospirillales bacterium]
MTRFEPISRRDMNTEQARVYDEIEGRGGRLGGPYQALIRIPAFMTLQQQMGDYLRANNLSDRERQLATLTAVRAASAKYAWAVQVRASHAAGIDQAVIDAINERRAPDLGSESDRVIFDVAKELAETRGLSQSTYEEAERILGLDRLTDVVVTVGFYGMVATTLNAFDISPPDDAPARLV